MNLRSTITALILGSALCMGTPGVCAQETASSEAFPDVNTQSPYYASIEYFRQQGIIEGYPDGTFRPQQEANRAEALKIILLASSVDVSGYDTGDPVFPDVTQQDWFYPYIKKAKELSIVEGYDDGYFKPVQVQNIAETLKMISETNAITPPTLEENTLVLPDVSSNTWYAPYAYYAHQKNIIEPQHDGTLNASRTLKRGELIELMYRMAIVKENNGTPFDISTNWPVESHAQHAFQTKRPFDWIVINHEDQVIFWRQDTVNHQSSYEVPFPYSGSMTFHLDHNTEVLSENDYSENLEYVYKSNFGSFQRNTFTIDGYSVLNLNVSLDHDDYFVFLPENKVLHIYTSYGWSDATDHIQAQINGIIDNLSYIPYQASTSSDVLSIVRERILIEEMGQETMDLFDDLIIIETDTIGVGTGPIDYFYSETYDITLKYERSTDTLLDMQNGQTSAF